MRKNIFYLLGLLFASATLQSCFDKDYDLNDIDMTIGLGVDDNNIFWLPKSSTGDIVIKDFIKLDDDDYLSVMTDGSGKEFYCLNASGSDAMNLVAIPGTLDMNINEGESTRIDLSKDPADFEEGSTTLDLASPMLFIELENKVPANIQCQMDFDCYTNNVKDATGITLNGFINVPANGKATYCFSDVEPSAYAKSFVTSDLKSAPWQQSSNLRNKLAAMPDFVQLNVSNVSMETNTPGATGDLDAKFTLFAPLLAGPSFKFVNKSTEDGWYSDLEMEDGGVEIKSLRIDADAENNMPLDIVIKGTPIDTNGNVIPGLTLTSASAKAGGTTHIALDLKANNGKITQYINGENRQQFDGLIIEVTGTGTAASQNQVLRPTDRLKLVNMKFGLVGGIVYDAN